LTGLTLPTQLYLDPAGAAANSRPATKTESIIDRDVRRFGFVPDISQLKPGDLLLISKKLCHTHQAARHKDLSLKSSKQIILHQETGGHAKEDARWYHAAVYISDFLICEATWPKVIVGDMFTYLKNQDHLLRFRSAPDLDINDRWKIVVNALCSLNEKYNLYAINKLRLLSKHGYWIPQKHDYDFQNAKFCSQLYRDAFQNAVKGKAICNTNYVTPADLSATPFLIDVEVDWLKLP